MAPRFAEMRRLEPTGMAINRFSQPHKIARELCSLPFKTLHTVAKKHYSRAQKFKFGKFYHLTLWHGERHFFVVHGTPYLPGHNHLPRHAQ
jgi:hypothetical protein